MLLLQVIKLSNMYSKLSNSNTRFSSTLTFPNFSFHPFIITITGRISTDKIESTAILLRELELEKKEEIEEHRLIAPRLKQYKSMYRHPSTALANLRLEISPLSTSTRATYTGAHATALKHPFSGGDL